MRTVKLEEILLVDNFFRFSHELNEKFKKLIKKVDFEIFERTESYQVVLMRAQIKKNKRREVLNYVRKYKARPSMILFQENFLTDLEFLLNEYNIKYKKRYSFYEVQLNELNEYDLLDMIYHYDAQEFISKEINKEGLKSPFENTLFLYLQEFDCEYEEIKEILDKLKLEYIFWKELIFIKTDDKKNYPLLKEIRKEHEEIMSRKERIMFIMNDYELKKLKKELDLYEIGYIISEYKYNKIAIYIRKDQLKKNLSNISSLRNLI